MPVHTQLMEHQRRIIDFCKDKDYAGIFAEYGTGKTLCILKLAEEKNLSKILIVCSKTAILATWPTQISEHTDFQYVYLTGQRANRIAALNLGLRKAKIPETYYSSESIKPVFFLINFDGIKSIYNEIVASNFDCLVVDESTKIKYPTTHRTKILWGLAKHIRKRYILTGWPITESVQDLYSQIKFLDGGAALGNNYYAFLDKYFTKIGYKRVPFKGSAKEIIDKVRPFCIRVTSEEALTLPPRRYFKYDINPTEVQTRLLRELHKYFQLEFGNVKIDTEYIFTLISKSLQICDGFIHQAWYNKKDNYVTCCKCGFNEEIEEDRKILRKVHCPKCKHPGAYELVDTEKDEALIDLLEEMDIKHNKLLIWTPFRFTVLKLQRLLTLHKYNVLTLTGDTEDVKSVIDKFMISKEHNILVMTEKKAGESLNLVNCNMALYYSNEYSYDRRANSEARIYRKGSEKHNSIIYIDFVTKNTIETKVYECLRNKGDLVNILKEEFQRTGEIN